MSHVITFYSYKGGTGRSMALANVAWVLASNGKRVLAIDWDLEAPGLHRYFQPFLTDKELCGQESQGVIDMVIDFAVRTATPVKEGERLSDKWHEVHADFSKWRQKLRWSSGETVRLGKTGTGGIDFVPAGRQGPDYAKRVNHFDWRSFYEKLNGGAFFDAAKRNFDAYDYVLIDSRTGVSDTSGICTVHMPDILVVCFTLNYQSIKGALAVAQSVRDQRPKMPIFPVPMRIDGSEEKLLNRMKNYAAEVFTPLLQPGINVREYWYSMEIPYFARYAYAEKLALFEDRGSITASTLPAMERLTEYLTAGDVRTAKPLPETQRVLALAEFEGITVTPPDKPLSESIEVGPDVFVSYSRLDWRHAAEIDSILRANGLRPFFDRRDLPPGLPWVRALEQAIGAAKAAVVLIGPHGLANTQQYERELAIVRQSRDPTFPVVAAILPGTTIDLPFDFLQVNTWIDFRDVTKVSDAPLELERLLAAVRGRPAFGEVVREATCPYRGLEAFREEDSAFFFGRGSADDWMSPIGQLVLKIREQPFVMVVGRSGSGKSSLIYAGLLPALRLGRDQFWHVLSLRPGSTPLQALAMAFNRRGDDDGAAEYAMKIAREGDRLRTGDPELLSRMIRQELGQAEGKPDRLLLYVDQWEELYAQAPSSADRERSAQHAADVNRFIDLLLNAARTAPVAVVATVRANFYDLLIGHPEIRALLPTRQVLLAAMSRAELESTIVEPAKKVGLNFDPPSLVQRILDDAGEDEGMLPLLQFALKESWALRKDNTITADGYARSGGVREAIRVTAERTFEALSAEDQQAARQLFLRLVTPGEGAGGQPRPRGDAYRPDAAQDCGDICRAGDTAIGDGIGPCGAANSRGRPRGTDPDLAAAARLDRCQPRETAGAGGGGAGQGRVGTTGTAR
jgi:MinD-like ATPase involved in chromosome partitioning or flagellar assembly/energy-coupling factor transporter ATP-binding protein EcfA2